MPGSRSSIARNNGYGYETLLSQWNRKLLHRRWMPSSRSVWMSSSNHCQWTAKPRLRCSARTGASHPGIALRSLGNRGRGPGARSSSIELANQWKRTDQDVASTWFQALQWAQEATGGVSGAGPPSSTFRRPDDGITRFSTVPRSTPSCRRASGAAPLTYPLDREI